MALSFDGEEWGEDGPLPGKVTALDAKTSEIQAEAKAFESTVRTSFAISWRVTVKDSDVNIPIAGDKLGQMKLWQSRRSAKLAGDFDWAAMGVLRPFENARMVNLKDQRYWPLTPFLLGGGVIPIAWDRQEQRVVLAGFDGGSGAGAASAATPLDAEYDFGPIVATVVYNSNNGGQSNGEGSGSTSAVTTAQPFANLTWPAGPKTRRPGNGFGVSTNVAALTDPILLVETNAETSVSGRLDGVVARAALKKQIDPSTFVMFGATVGRGGQGLDVLMPGAAPIAGNTEPFWRIVEDHFDGLVTWFGPLSRPIRSTSLFFEHGEADKTMLASVYEAKLEAYCNAYQAYVMSRTGQTVPPHIFLGQPAEGVRNHWSGGPAIAMHRLALRRRDIHIAGGKWHLPLVDGTHMSRVSHRRRGDYGSLLEYDLLVERVYPQTTYNVANSFDGEKVKARFAVRTPPIRFDVRTVAEVANKGLRMVAGEGSAMAEIEIADLAVGDSQTLHVFPRYPADVPPNARLRVAADYLAAGLSVTEGASCNIRDSTEERSFIEGVEYPIHFWAAHSDLAIRRAVY